MVSKHLIHWLSGIIGRRFLITKVINLISWQNILACAPGVEPTWKVIR